MKKAIQAAAEQLRIHYDTKTGAGFGTYNGYTVLIHTAGGENKDAEILFYVSKNGSQLPNSELPPVRLPADTSGMAVGYAYVITVRGAKKRQDNTDRIVLAVIGMTDAFAAAGGVNCDRYGAEGISEVYYVKGEFAILGMEAEAKLRAEMHAASVEAESIKENPFLGIVGAILGSLVGVGLFLLLGRLNVVSVVGGLLLGIGIVFGYRKLGRKLSIPSGILLTILSVLITYAAFRLDAAIDVHKAWEGTLTFPESIKMTKYTFELAKSMSTYYGNLILTMVCGVGGSVACVWGAVQEEKEKLSMRKLGQ